MLLEIFLFVIGESFCLFVFGLEKVLGCGVVECVVGVGGVVSDGGYY